MSLLWFELAFNNSLFSVKKGSKILLSWLVLVAQKAQPKKTCQVGLVINSSATYRTVFCRQPVLGDGYSSFY